MNSEVLEVSDKLSVDIRNSNVDEFISQSECESIIETLYLLSHAANQEWLMESRAQADRGELIPFRWVGDAGS